MKLNVLSDLHLSQAGMPLPDNDADVVVLAGDIARPHQAIDWARGFRKPVLYVPGNHEFYGGDIAGTVERLKELAAGTNVHVLADSEACIAGVRFLGSTLWTDFRLFGDGAGRDSSVEEALEHMRDFSRIFRDPAQQSRFTPQDAAALFTRHSAWLAQALRTPHLGPTVVVTHHAPSPRSIEPRYRDSPLSACFASRADHLLQGGRARMWIHGHMHHSVDYRVGGTRIVSNPRGYAKDGQNENPRFDPDFIVHLA